VKGQSGNPRGRPPGVARAARKLIGRNGEKALRFLADLMDGKISAVRLLGADGDVLELKQQLPPVKERRQAAVELLNRACGKAAQPVELSGPNGGPVRTTVDLRGLSDAQLDELGALLSAAEAAAGGADAGGGQGREGA
jgi:hypothetical protein